MLRVTSCVVGTALMIAWVAPASADRIDEIEKELIQAHGNMKSYTAKTRLTFDSGMGEEGACKSDETGTHEWMRQGDRVLYRIESKGTSVIKAGGEDIPSVTKNLVVSDGTYMCVLSETNGQKSAIKHKADPRTAGDVAFIFEGMKSEYKLKVLPEDAVDGQPCYVIEGTANNPDGDAGTSMVRQVTYFSKVMGVAVKMIGYDAKGNEVFVSQTTEIKLNAAIDPARFKFEAPKGVHVFDMSNMPKPGGAKN